MKGQLFRLGVGAVATTLAITLASTTGLVAADGAPPRADVPTCRPEPPDYPGCTREQVLPYERVQFRHTMTGHQPHYRYWEMGQKPRGHLFDGISYKLDRHLAAVWWAAYDKAKARAEARGVKFEPAFVSWAAFRDNASAGCPSAIVVLAMPWAWCAAHASGYTDNDWRAALWAVTKAEFGCTGVIISWHMMKKPGEALLTAAGRLKGGYWEPVAQQTTCVCLWAFNELYDFFGKGQP